MSKVPAIQRVSRRQPVSDVYRRLDAIVRPVESCSIELCAAAGRVLADDVQILQGRPSRALATRDGWAVCSDHVRDAGSYEPVRLAKPSAWVEIGDPLPEGCDAVLSLDSVVETNGGLEAIAPAAPSDGICAPNADASPSQVLKRRGERLRPHDIAVLGAAGFRQLSVRAPRVVVATAHPNIDVSSDITGRFIARAIQDGGGSASLHHCGGDTERLTRILATEDADAVITIGGTGEGRRDDVVSTLARVGRVEIHGMALRPGETAGLGAIGSRPVLMVPGRLDAALAVWLVVGRYLLAQLSGQDLDEVALGLNLTRKIVSTIGISDVVLLARRNSGVEPLASGNFPLQSISLAYGWAVIPPESEGAPAGSPIKVWVFP